MSDEDGSADQSEASTTTTIRWTAAQVALIKRAAAAFGMPYQTYVKDAAFRRALHDLRAVEQTRTS